MEKIFERQELVKQRLYAAQDEHNLWQLAHSMAAHEYLFRDSDVMSGKTAMKFALLAQVAKYLSRKEVVEAGGSKSIDIFWEVQPRFSNLTLSNFKTVMSRFKAEGRLLRDGETGNWTINKVSGSVSCK